MLRGWKNILRGKTQRREKKGFKWAFWEKSELFSPSFASLYYTFLPQLTCFFMRLFFSFFLSLYSVQPLARPALEETWRAWLSSCLVSVFPLHTSSSSSHSLLTKRQTKWWLQWRWECSKQNSSPDLLLLLQEKKRKEKTSLSNSVSRSLLEQKTNLLLVKVRLSGWLNVFFNSVFTSAVSH